MYSRVVTTLITPSGTPARRANYMYGQHKQTGVIYRASAIAKAENGVSEGGLITTVHPAASAGATFRVIIAEGKFCEKDVLL